MIFYRIPKPFRKHATFALRKPGFSLLFVFCSSFFIFASISLLRDSIDPLDLITPIIALFSAFLAFYAVYRQTDKQIDAQKIENELLRTQQKDFNEERKKERNHDIFRHAVELVSSDNLTKKRIGLSFLEQVCSKDPGHFHPLTREIIQTLFDLYEGKESDPFLMQLIDRLVSGESHLWPWSTNKSVLRIQNVKFKHELCFHFALCENIRFDDCHFRSLKFEDCYLRNFHFERCEIGALCAKYADLPMLHIYDCSIGDMKFLSCNLEDAMFSHLRYPKGYVPIVKTRFCNISGAHWQRNETLPNSLQQHLNWVTKDFIEQRDQNSDYFPHDQAAIIPMDLLEQQPLDRYKRISKYCFKNLASNIDHLPQSSP